MYYFLKIAVTSILVVLISEAARKNTLAGAILASIPLVSIMAFIWLYIDTKNTFKIIELSYNIFWLVIPSLFLFIALPFFLNNGINFYLSLTMSMGLTIGMYFLMISVLNHFGVKF
jgi:hypothetical protein